MVYVSVVHALPSQDVLAIDTILLPSDQSVQFVPSVQFIQSVPSVTSKSKVVASVKVILYVFTSQAVFIRVTLAIPLPVAQFKSLFRPLLVVHWGLCVVSDTSINGM